MVARVFLIAMRMARKNCVCIPVACVYLPVKRVGKVFAKNQVEALGKKLAAVSFGIAANQSGEDLAAFVGRACDTLRNAWGRGVTAVVAVS